MTRLLAILGAATVLIALGASTALAHPLGNFTINHLSRVKISNDRVEVLYILDQAEIPTFEERELAPGEVLERKRQEVANGLGLLVDGRRVTLRPEPGAKLSFPPGQGGLETTRVELALIAEVDDPSRVELRDNTFSSRDGLRATVSEPGEGTAVRTGAPSNDPTRGLRVYPEDVLQSPTDQRSARFAVEPGDGTLVAPVSQGGEEATTQRPSDGFAGVFESAAAGEGVLVLLIAAAFAWGAFHALSPGHGKAMVAAYLVGSRGDARHAFALGGVVTVTHTIGVFALGLVALLLSQYLLPEDLYPWLTLASGLLVVAIGAGVLRSRIRWSRARRASGKQDAAMAAGQHSHSHADFHEHGHWHVGHGHSATRAPAGDLHAHSHSHAAGDHHQHMPDEITWKGLLGMGVSAGLIPCPSALVVLLGAIAQHQVAVGLLLIVAFSVGLAVTLTGLGIAVVYAGRLTSRLDFRGRIAASLPTLSALVIVAVGCVLTAQAVPSVV